MYSLRRAVKGASFKASDFENQRMPGEYLAMAKRFSKRTRLSA